MGRTFEILLVEDDPADVVLFRKALESARFEYHLHIACDGVEALDFVRQRGERAEAPRPDLVLLDLHLPRKDGRAVLAEIKADASLQDIPVLVLSTSQSPEDIEASYAGRASTYIEKALDAEGFRATVRHIERYWLNAVEGGGSHDPRRGRQTP